MYFKYVCSYKCSANKNDISKLVNAITALTYTVNAATSATTTAAKFASDVANTATIFLHILLLLTYKANFQNYFISIRSSSNFQLHSTRPLPILECLDCSFRVPRSADDEDCIPKYLAELSIRKDRVKAIHNLRITKTEELENLQRLFSS